MFKRVVHSNIGAAVLNMAVAYLVWMLSRVAFFAENWSTFAPYMSWSLFKSMLHGSLVFDTSALLYVNALYLALMLLPLHLKERPGFHKALKWLFVVTNAVAIAMNLMDAVYFQYTGRRSTVTVFTEFANEGNITSILLTEFIRHWYLVLAFVALVLMFRQNWILALVGIAVVPQLVQDVRLQHDIASDMFPGDRKTQLVEPVMNMGSLGPEGNGPVISALLGHVLIHVPDGKVLNLLIPCDKRKSSHLGFHAQVPLVHEKSDKSAVFLVLPVPSRTHRNTAPVLPAGTRISLQDISGNGFVAGRQLHFNTHGIPSCRMIFAADSQRITDFVNYITNAVKNKTEKGCPSSLRPVK